MQPRPTSNGPAPKPDAAADETERLLDEALEETFPASDPIAPMSTRERAPRRAPRRGGRGG